MGTAADLPEYALRLAYGNRMVQDKPLTGSVPHVSQLRGDFPSALRRTLKRDIGRIFELDGELALVEERDEVRLDSWAKEHKSRDRQRREKGNRRLREAQNRPQRSGIAALNPPVQPCPRRKNLRHQAVDALATTA